MILGCKTRLYTVTELVLKLGEIHKNGTLKRLLMDLCSLDLLIQDTFWWTRMNHSSYRTAVKAKAQF